MIIEASEAWEYRNLSLIHKCGRPGSESAHKILEIDRDEGYNFRKSFEAKKTKREHEQALQAWREGWTDLQEVGIGEESVRSKSDGSEAKSYSGDSSNASTPRMTDSPDSYLDEKRRERSVEKGDRLMTSPVCPVDTAIQEVKALLAARTHIHGIKVPLRLDRRRDVFTEKKKVGFEFPTHGSTEDASPWVSIGQSDQGHVKLTNYSTSSQENLYGVPVTHPNLAVIPDPFTLRVFTKKIFVGRFLGVVIGKVKSSLQATGRRGECEREHSFPALSTEGGCGAIDTTNLLERRVESVSEISKLVTASRSTNNEQRHPKQLPTYLRTFRKQPDESPSSLPQFKEDSNLMSDKFPSSIVLIGNLTSRFYLTNDIAAYRKPSASGKVMHSARGNATRYLERGKGKFSECSVLQLRHEDFSLRFPNTTRSIENCSPILHSIDRLKESPRVISYASGRVLWSAQNRGAKLLEFRKEGTEVGLQVKYRSSACRGRRGTDEYFLTISKAGYDIVRLAECDSRWVVLETTRQPDLAQILRNPRGLTEHLYSVHLPHPRVRGTDYPLECSLNMDPLDTRLFSKQRREERHANVILSASGTALGSGIYNASYLLGWRAEMGESSESVAEPFSMGFDRRLVRGQQCVAQLPHPFELFKPQVFMVPSTHSKVVELDAVVPDYVTVRFKPSRVVMKKAQPSDLYSMGRGEKSQTDLKVSKFCTAVGTGRESAGFFFLSTGVVDMTLISMPRGRQVEERHEEHTWSGDETPPWLKRTEVRLMQLEDRSNSILALHNEWQEVKFSRILTANHQMSYDHFKLLLSILGIREICGSK